MAQDGQVVYVFGDGDRVGERLENLLLCHDLDALSKLSKGLEDAIRSMAGALQETMEAEVIVAGGDDLLVRIPLERYSRSGLEQLAENYRERIGTSMSFGVGTTIDSGYLNLRRAKASSGTKIIESGVSL